ncbi:unnamed protein product [Cylicocyclus nassatus]|uniref:SCP domain-containing protein n=1 Tax=Cylicocyclus nassatus TaxID=53992 RepID=A0AA36M1H8_CYLNA|nr:unnamed protein product [Cylicocyclus nassatus]
MFRDSRIITNFLACKPDKLMKHALWEHNRRRSKLALGNVRTKNWYMWRAAFMMELKENCLLTKRLRAQKKTCRFDDFDRSIFGMRNARMVNASSKLDALERAISKWWNEVKKYPRPESLQIENYLKKHKHFLPMALSYQEYLSCSVDLCDDLKKERKKRRYFVQCFYSEMPERNHSLYEKGPKCSKHCFGNKDECVGGLCRVPYYQYHSNFVY